MFKAYNKEFLERVGIESDNGFTLGLEMIVKAKLNNYKVGEIPTIWIDRNFGESKFKFKKIFTELYLLGWKVNNKKNEKTVLVTGSEGFIGGYIVKNLLDKGYKVIGIDNLTKYGEIRNHSDNDKYEFHNNDVKDKEKLKNLMKQCDFLIAGVAMIGGISYFHEFEYDLISENEKITFRLNCSCLTRNNYRCSSINKCNRPSPVFWIFNN